MAKNRPECFLVLTRVYSLTTLNGLRGPREAGWDGDEHSRQVAHDQSCHCSILILNII